MDMKLELVAVPVSDPDRAKAFYTEQVGFNADHDIPVQEGLRFIQLTPPGLGVLDRARGGDHRRGARQRRAGCSWWWPAPPRPTTSSPAAASRSPRSRSSRGGSSCSSPTPTATGGRSRRSPRGRRLTAAVSALTIRCSAPAKSDIRPPFLIDSSGPVSVGAAAGRMPTAEVSRMLTVEVRGAPDFRSRRGRRAHGRGCVARAEDGVACRQTRAPRPPAALRRHGA